MSDYDFHIQMVIRRIAGLFVLGSLALAWWVDPRWFLFTAFVGFNLIQSSFTNFCPLEMILRRVIPQRAAGAS